MVTNDPRCWSAWMEDAAHSDRTPLRELPSSAPDFPRLALSKKSAACFFFDAQIPNVWTQICFIMYDETWKRRIGMLFPTREWWWQPPERPGTKFGPEPNPSKQSGTLVWMAIEGNRRLKRPAIEICHFQFDSSYSLKIKCMVRLKRNNRKCTFPGSGGATEVGSIDGRRAQLVHS